MEYRGSSAWKEVAISQVEEYLWLNLMYRILHDFVRSFEMLKGFVRILRLVRMLQN